MQELEALLDDLMSEYADRYERLEFLAQVYVCLQRLAIQEGFSPDAVSHYAAAISWGTLKP